MGTLIRMMRTSDPLMTALDLVVVGFQQLNSTNNFSAFVGAMRKCFKAKCA